MNKVKSKDKTILIFSIALVLLMIVNLFLFLKVTRLEKLINEFFKPIEDTGLNIGDKVPDFNLIDINDKEISLNDLNNKKLLLIFTLINCPACNDLYDDIKEFEEKHEEINIAVIVNGSIDNIKKIKDKYNLSSIILNDKERLTLKSYKINSFPFANLIDENSILINKGFVNSIDDLENLLSTTK